MNTNNKDSEINKHANNIIERPRICSIDLTQTDFDVLKAEKYNLFEGTLGSIMQLPNKSSRDTSYILLDHDFPPNFHEYDILILDLINEKTKDYKREEHSIIDTKQKVLYN